MDTQDLIVEYRENVRTCIDAMQYDNKVKFAFWGGRLAAIGDELEKTYGFNHPQLVKEHIVDRYGEETYKKFQQYWINVIITYA